MLSYSTEIQGLLLPHSQVILLQSPEYQYEFTFLSSCKHNTLFFRIQKGNWSVSKSSHVLSGKYHFPHITKEKTDLRLSDLAKNHRIDIAKPSSTFSLCVTARHRSFSCQYMKCPSRRENVSEDPHYLQRVRGTGAQKVSIPDLLPA